MTNEQLAQLIGQGGNDELLPLLWEKMRKLYIGWSGSFYNAHKERCDNCGVTVDDLRQEGYLSMLEAVKAYTSRTDEHKDTLFTSYCSYPFKNHAAELIGIRTTRTRNEPLNRYRGDIDSPLDGIEGETIGTTTPDPEAEQPYRDVEQADYCRVIRETVKAAMTKLPRELEIIERRYYNGEALKDIAADMGICEERARQLKQRAFEKLRNTSKVRALAEISFYRHVSLNSFRRTRKSAVERIAEERERRHREFLKMAEEYRRLKKEEETGNIG